ncbi:CYTH and CHAD domain-containing protein [Sinomonas gamaensis]|uniref:CYTH and CHAD domain-containing protein n=1 Tax=Sinomonas gamaensis TaxID=2565624 RepID=UPI001107BB24|nr:CYTH and CHAD domain-containing protein [Sinomonas gamaensis]
MARTPSAAAFNAAHAGRFPELGKLPGVAEVRLQGDFVFEEQYFDTFDLRLASKGIVLYRKSGGPGQGWHLERPGVPEQVEPLGTRSDPPEALTGQLQFYLRGNPVVPSVEVTIVRRVSHLLGPEETPIGSVGDEHHRAEPLLADGEPRAWRLWDYAVAERGNGIADDLRDVFLDAGARPLKRSDSLLSVRRARRTGAKQAPSRLKGKAARVFAAYVGEQLAQLEQLDPDARSGDPEAIHRLRVALRRLRTALSAFRKDLDGDARRTLNDELQWLCRVLGQVRDTAVMKERLRGRLRDEAPELVLGPVGQAIDEYLGAEHRAAAEALAEALASERYFRLLDALDRIAWVGDDGGERFATKPRVAVVVRRDARRLRAAMSALAEADGGAAAGQGREAHDRALHEVRKAAKKVRYAAELAQPFGRKKARRVRKKAARIQKVLGEHQDCVVTADLLRRLAIDAYGRGENAFTFGRLHARELELAAQAEAEFEQLRRKLPTKLGGRL